MSTPILEFNGETPWWSDGLYFSCVGCGRCCKGEPGTVSLTEAEMELISQSMKITLLEFQELYMWRKYGKLSLKERDNYDCVFLDNATDKCKIYPLRPFQCSSFPFWPELMRSKIMWDRYAALCPGMNQGKYYDFAAIKQYLEN